MFHPDRYFCAPRGGDLLTELGIRPDLVREVIEGDRAIRCPDRGAVFPERRFADLYPEPPLGQGLHEAAPAEPWDQAPARRPAGRRSRRA